MRLLVGTALACIAGATALVVMLPMAIYGGVINVEPNVFVRWGEFAVTGLASVLGMLEIQAEIRRMCALKEGRKSGTNRTDLRMHALQGGKANDL